MGSYIPGTAIAQSGSVVNIAYINEKTDLVTLKSITLRGAYE